MPLLLAFAVFDGWSEVLWVLGVFFALELVLVNFAEPLLYGKSAGLSPIAIIAAALFWTWLWGPIGLLLATPITVCIAVMGRYIPEMGYLNVLLGVEPVLEPEARFYQRLIAMDEEEAEDLAEKYANEHGLAALHQEMVIPALALAERDRHNNALDEERSRFVFDTTRHIVEYVEDRSATAEKEKPASNVVPRPAPPLCIVGAHDEADHVAGLALARLLSAPEFNPKVIAFPLLAAESLEEIVAQSCKTVCISAVPPNAAMHAAFLCKRLKQRLPDVRVLVALWTSENSEKAQERLRQAGVDQVATTARRCHRAPARAPAVQAASGAKTGTNHGFPLIPGGRAFLETTLSDALAFMYSRRASIHPGGGFMKHVLAALAFFIAFTAQAQDRVIRIGVLMPISGPGSYFGVMGKEGIDLALEQVAKTDLNGYKLQVQYEDSACSPLQATNTVKRVLDQFKPHIVIGEECSDASLAIAPILEQAKVVQLNAGSVTMKLTESGYKYVFRIFPNAEQQSAPLVKVAREQAEGADGGDPVREDQRRQRQRRGLREAVRRRPAARCSRRSTSAAT